MHDDWSAPDYWCTICNRGAEGCEHTPADADDEEFCDVCLAGTTSDKHLTSPCGENER